MVRTGICLGALLCGLTLAGCGSEQAAAGNGSVDTGHAQQSVAEALAGAGELRHAARMMRATGLDRTLGGVGTYTLFVPVDHAFGALPQLMRAQLESSEGRPQSVALMNLHIAPGYITREDIDDSIARTAGNAQIATLNGGRIDLGRQGDVVTLGRGADAARIVGTPIAARNGMIYPLDRFVTAAAAAD